MGHQENIYNIRLAHIIKFVLGLSLGPIFIVGYIITIGSAFHFKSDAFSVMLFALAICFIFEYLLEISSGYRADKFGEKLTMLLSIMFRIFHVLLIFLGISLSTASPISFILIIFFAELFFAISFTLASGNFEDWLQKQCPKEGSLHIFAVNNACMYTGIAIGLSSCVILLPSYQYSTLQSEVIPLFGISIICSLLSIILIMFMRNTKRFILSDIHRFFASYYQYDKKNQKEMKINIIAVKNELSENKDLNRMFWLHAIYYGIHIAYETLIPIYVFASQGFNVQEKFVLLVFCYLIPTVIGSLSKTKKQKMPAHSLSLLSKELYIFFGLAIIIACISIFPFSDQGIWYTDPVFLAFGVAIILFQITSGRVSPQFYDYCSKLARQYSKLPKTLLSIGERRKKIGAILSLIIAASGALFSIKEAYFWVIALMALGGIFYCHYVFRHIFHEDYESDIAIENKLNH